MEACFLIGHLVRPFEPQNLPGLGRRGGFNTQFTGDPFQLGHLFSTAFGQNPFAQVEVILKARPGVTAHEQGVGGHGKLCASGRANRPLEVADLLPGGLYQIYQVLHGGGNAARKPQYELKINRCFDMAMIDQIGQIIE